MLVSHAGNSDATAASLATAFAAGGSTAQSYAAAVAQAMSQNGCGPYQATLASAYSHQTTDSLIAQILSHS